MNAAPEALSENQALRERLEELEAVLAAVRSGTVDALMVGSPGAERVFTLKGAETPYRAFVEAMREGAATVDAGGAILYGNEALAGLMKKALKKIIGAPATELVVAQDRAGLEELLRAGGQRELALATADGSRVPALVAAAPLPSDGQNRQIALVVSDLREREQGAQMRRMLDQAARLSELGENLHSSLAWQEAYEVIGRDLPRLLPATAGALFVFDPGGGPASAKARWGEPVALCESWAPKDCQSVRRGRLHGVTDSANAQNCVHFAGAPPHCYLCVPLTAQGELIGVLHVQRDAPRPAYCSEEETYLVKAIAQHAALALANLGLREKLQEQASRDSLTGLYNRHHERAWLEHELRRAARHGERLVAILADLDHFKQVNDRFGHDAGDRVLQAFGVLLKGAIRGSDIACRHGGEEFLLLLSGASLDGAVQRAEAIRASLSRLELADAGRPLGAITASFGLAAYPDHAADAESLLRAADAALYLAKEGGRDRVMVAAASAAPSAALR